MSTFFDFGFIQFVGFAAQCLEVVIIHIPIFKSHFEVRVPPKQYVLLSQFDQILKARNSSFSTES